MLEAQGGSCLSPGAVAPCCIDGAPTTVHIESTLRQMWRDFCESSPNERTVQLPAVVRCFQVVQTQDLQGDWWEVKNFSNTVWEAAIWMHHFFQVQAEMNRAYFGMFVAATSLRPTMNYRRTFQQNENLKVEPRRFCTACLSCTRCSSRHGRTYLAGLWRVRNQTRYSNRTQPPCAFLNPR